MSMTNSWIASSATSASASNTLGSTVQHLQILFRKGDGTRFLSHLDLMSTLEFSMRRARLPMALSEGFNPRPRFSLAAPLAVGYVGEAEILEIELKEPRAIEEVHNALQHALPTGLTVVSVREIEPGARSAASRIRGATYRVQLPQQQHDLEDRARALEARPTLEIEEAREDRVRKRDIRPLIDSVVVIDPQTMRMVVRAGDTGTVRPEQILEQMGLSSQGIAVTREEIHLSG
jgi:radical SAM-linked protein